eukprot:15197020-Alexandrium_andersonii.AAC.1
MWSQISLERGLSQPDIFEGKGPPRGERQLRGDVPSGHARSQRALRGQAKRFGSRLDRIGSRM